MKLALFTDTLEDINGVARFIRDMGERAADDGRQFVIHTCASGSKISNPRFARRSFDPLVSMRLPYYPQLSVSLPPVWEMLHWVEQQRFDMIHCSTPGPVGMCGWLIARWLGIPLGATYHTDFPAYVERLAGSRWMAAGTTLHMKLFYRQADLVFARSREYQEILVGLGIARDKLRTVKPAIDLRKFNPSFRDESVWRELGVAEPLRLLYIGRISVEKNLPLLVDTFKALRERRRDVALIVVGEGPYFEPMKSALTGLPAYLPGVMGDRDLARLYCSADLFVFPSRTDTLGQVVMESQACGLPVLVSDAGGPQGIIAPGETGLIIRGNAPADWVDAIDQLLHDPARRARMSRAAAERMRQFDLTETFRHFWNEHLAVASRRRRGNPREIIHAAPGPADPA